MLKERPLVEEALLNTLSKAGIQVKKQDPNPEHAGGKWELRFTSLTGQQSRVDTDINYMLRVPLFPPRELESKPFGIFKTRFNLMDFHEIAAGKIVALFARQATRDVFDSINILSYEKLDIERLRTAFVVYAAFQRADFRNLKIHDLQYNPDFKKDLFFLLKKADIDGKILPSVYKEMIDKCKDKLKKILPFTAEEKEFLNRVSTKGEIIPELITSNPDTQDRIKKHPMLLWKCLHARKHHASRPKP